MYNGYILKYDNLLYVFVISLTLLHNYQCLYYYQEKCPIKLKSDWPVQICIYGKVYCVAYYVVIVTSIT